MEGSLREDGTRRFVHPADVQGRFTRVRHAGFVVLIGLLIAAPFVQLGGHPLVFLDVPARKFYLFGGTFNAQDFWLTFFLLTGAAFFLIVLTAVLGRVWCGYACPQTVFLEGVYRRIERWIEGPRVQRLRRNAGPWTFDKAWRKTLKHTLFGVVSLLLAHVFLSYFVSLPGLVDMVRTNPAAHPSAFVWMACMAGLLYVNFAWFREQLCLIVCPYGRLQSALTDSDTLVIGYDRARGEPRGKATDPGAGDCVDCKRCVVVCPTGIDIRNGLQMECIGCAACVDACDEIMLKLGRKPGLVRYDSLTGFAGKARHFWRKRLWLYAALGAIGIVAASLALGHRASFEANLLRLSGAPYTVQDGQVRNAFELHLVNKRSDTVTFHLQPLATGPLEFAMATREVPLGSLQSRRIPIFVTSPRSAVSRGALEVRVQISVADGERSDEVRVATARFLAPRSDGSGGKL